MSGSDKWIHKGPEEEEIPQLDKSFGDFLLQRIRYHGNKIIQIDGPSGEAVSAAQLLARSVSVALELRARGVRPGHVVSAALDNGLEVAYVMLGALYVGAVYTPFNPNLDDKDTRHLVQLLAPRLVLCAPRAEAKVRAALPPGGEVVGVRRGSPDWAPFLQQPPAAAADFLPATGLDLDAPAFIMCSSGTTGAPKGVMLSHRSVYCFLQSAEKLDTESPTEDSAKDIHLLVLPNFWISSFGTTLVNLGTGIPLVIYQTFDVNVILAGIEKHKITALFLMPHCIVAIAKHPNIEKYDVTSLKRLSYGGAPTSPMMREVAEKRMKKRFQHIYGQTECMYCLCPGEKSYEKPVSVGLPTCNASAKIIDTATEAAVGAYVEGEICVKAPTMFSGYYGKPEATAEFLDGDGWLHTGDVGYFDDEGYFFVCERYKDQVVYKGIHMAPAEVEALLVAHEGVKDAAVVSIEHNEDLEHPVGFVVLQEGHEVPKEELLQLVRDQLPEYKQLHGGIHYIEDIPRTATGKIKRRLLRQLARSLEDQQTENRKPHSGHKDCNPLPFVGKEESANGY